MSTNPNLHLKSDRKIVSYLDHRLRSPSAVVVESIALAANDTIAELTRSTSQELNHLIRNAMQCRRRQPMFRSTNWNARLNVMSAAEN